jgi:branched-chain amino acid transport system permease protein
MLLAAAARWRSVVGPLLERTLLARFYGRDEVLLLLVTYALFLMLEDIAKLIWGVNPYFVTAPYQLFGNVTLPGGMRVVGYDLLLVVLALVCGVASWFGSTAPARARSCLRSSTTRRSARAWA